MTTDVRIFSAKNNSQTISGLADVLIDCVEGGASISFMSPLSREKAEHFWVNALNSADKGERTILIAEDVDSGAILGTVQLVLNLPENQPHRGDISKMLVHRQARRRGIGAALMLEIEKVASRLGRTLLVLDTATGGDAERLYTRSGWQRVGIIPDFALWPKGDRCSTTVFYRKLDSEEQLS